jgi:hypothetical protein
VGQQANGAQMPRFKDVSKVGNCVHLGDACGRRRPCKGAGNNLKAMDSLILCGWCRDRKVGIAEFNRIGDNLAFGDSIDKFEAAVQLQGCRKPLRIVPYVRTLVQYIRTFGTPN